MRPVTTAYLVLLCAAAATWLVGQTTARAQAGAELAPAAEAPLPGGTGGGDARSLRRLCNQELSKDMYWRQEQKAVCLERAAASGGEGGRGAGRTDAPAAAIGLAEGDLGPGRAAAQSDPDNPFAVFYRSPHRARCVAEIGKDPEWAGQLEAQCLAAARAELKRRAELKKELRPLVHAEDAESMLRNKRHVVASYAALWVLVVVFVGGLFRRQKRLHREVVRLQRELERAQEG